MRMQRWSKLPMTPFSLLMECYVYSYLYAQDSRNPGNQTAKTVRKTLPARGRIRKHRAPTQLVASDAYETVGKANFPCFACQAHCTSSAA